MSKFPDAPLNTKYPDMFYRVGAISLQWNQIDYRLEALLGIYLSKLDERDKLMSHLSNRQRAQILDMFINELEHGEWLDYALHILKGVNILRENRNFLLHGIVHEMGEDYIVLERFTRKLDQKSRLRVSIEHLKEVERAMMVYGAHSANLLTYPAPFRPLLAPRPLPLLEKPPLPDKLEKILPEVLVDEPHPPRS